jgi:hypothetical protein
MPQSSKSHSAREMGLAKGVETWRRGRRALVPGEHARHPLAPDGNGNGNRWEEKEMVGEVGGQDGGGRTYISRLGSPQLYQPRGMMMLSM